VVLLSVVLLPVVVLSDVVVMVPLVAEVLVAEVLVAVSVRLVSVRLVAVPLVLVVVVIEVAVVVVVVKESTMGSEVRPKGKTSSPVMTGTTMRRASEPSVGKSKVTCALYWAGLHPHSFASPDTASSFSTTAKASSITRRGSTTPDVGGPPSMRKTAYLSTTLSPWRSHFTTLGPNSITTSAFPSRPSRSCKV
jgi:hypothetical protein